MKKQEKKKHVNPSKFLHEVYTENGGVKEYNDNQQTLGILTFIGTVIALRAIGHIAERIFDKIADRPIKALEGKEKDKCS